MFETMDNAILEHKMLSELLQVNPEQFEVTTRAMLEKIISQGKNPDVLRAIQKEVDGMKARALSDKITALKEKFNSERS